MDLDGKQKSIIDHVKTTLKMEMLQAQSPEMVRRNLCSFDGLQPTALFDVAIS